MCGQRYTCDECGESVMTDEQGPTCPECGASMAVDPPGEDS
jgi:rubrerythrin